MNTRLTLILLGFILSNLYLPVQACTLWGIAGKDAPATLIAKNRDWRPDHQQSLRLIRPTKGLPYLGLFADDGRSPGLKAGINQAGVVVVSASASSLSQQQRHESSAQKSVMRRILRDYHSLDQVAAGVFHLFSNTKPMFLLLADPHGLMQVEIGLNGKYSIKRQQQGWLAHTNHYSDLSLINGQQKIGKSSEVRLQRVHQLLMKHQGTWQLSDMQQISYDQHDGPNDSLWRSGIEHTLAGLQVALPQNAAPVLLLRLANPGHPIQDLSFTLDKLFWQRPAGVIK